MKQRRRLIVKYPDTTAAGKVSVSFLPRFHQMFSLLAEGKSGQTGVTIPAPVSRHRDKSVMTLRADKAIFTGKSISGFLFVGCLS
jgi:hypothetical protein